jgi:hypothetical protein
LREYPSVRHIERVHGVRWAELVELEPALHALLHQARRAGASCREWQDVDRIFSPLRNDLAELVGFSSKHARHPVLGSVGAYDVAYWKLFDSVTETLEGAPAY